MTDEEVIAKLKECYETKELSFKFDNDFKAFIINNHKQIVTLTEEGWETSDLGIIVFPDTVYSHISKMRYTMAQIESALKIYIFFNRNIIESVIKPDFKTGEVEANVRFMIDDTAYCSCRIKYNIGRIRYQKVFDHVKVVYLNNSKDMVKHQPMFDLTAIMYNMIHYNYIVEDLTYNEDTDTINMVVFNKHEGGYRSAYLLGKRPFRLNRLEEKLIDEYFEEEGLKPIEGSFEFSYVFNGYGYFIALHSHDAYYSKLYMEYFNDKPNEQYTGTEYKDTPSSFSKNNCLSLNYCWERIIDDRRAVNNE